MTPKQAVAQARAGGANPFLVLGVPPTCTEEQVVAAHRALVRLLHPDRNQDPAAQQACALVNVAYTQLNTQAGRRAAALLYAVEATHTTCKACNGAGTLAVQRKFKKMFKLCDVCAGRGVY